MIRKIFLCGITFIFIIISVFTLNARAEDSNTQELAKKLANPVSSLISVPIQNTYICCSGTNNAGRFTTNIQPVVPFSLNSDWNLIVRTILPIIHQDASAPDIGAKFGLGDTVQSFFLSPVKEHDGLIWGAGPAFLWPTATNAMLGSQKWGAGPTVVALKQMHGWTFGGLANHIWSFAGESDRQNVSATMVQPFLSYTFPNTVGLSLNSEMTYDWTNAQWTIPVDVGISKVFTFAKQHVSLGVTGQYYARKADNGPDWGARFTATFLFPK
ncbi:hypothetical protein [Pseudochrobactrum kiredjianiae]|uniref:Transporter n=1 Tax=Pseudochrobactrum kiredjianiae TaxID=386305 RepID=A0ABW3V7Z2_9HYPH|nr:hypothetical protein [Pseudochrobactrum kiredjianiae]